LDATLRPYLNPSVSPDDRVCTIRKSRRDRRAAANEAKPDPTGSNVAVRGRKCRQWVPRLRSAQSCTAPEPDAGENRGYSQGSYHINENNLGHR